MLCIKTFRSRNRDLDPGQENAMDLDHRLEMQFQRDYLGDSGNNGDNQMGSH